MSKLTDIMTSPWAITVKMYQEIGGIYLTHCRGEKIDIKAIEARMGEPLQNQHEDVTTVNGVAVIDVHGVIAKRMNMFTKISGGVSTELLANDIQASIDDPNVKAIILDIDSPGGTVDGTFELADEIYKARGTKPIVALANGLMASAAYAIGSAADQVYMTGETTHVGSIGVVTSHTDYSKAEKIAGIKTTEIFAGKYKRIASQHAPLTEEGKQSIQDSVDYLYSIFVERVSKFRGVSVDTVVSDMADGRLFIGQQAIDAGLVDGITSLDQLITDLSMGQEPTKQTAAVADDAGVASDDEAGNNNSINSDLEDSNMKETIQVAAINAAYLVDSHPDLVAEITAEAVEAAKIEGATVERERIQEVRAQSMPGHEDLIESLAFDGKTTGPEAAVQVLAAENKNKKTVAADISDDAAVLSCVESTVDAGTGESDLDALPLEERCEAKWKQGESLRAEFADNFTAYVAYMKANENGQVRVLKDHKKAS